MIISQNNLVILKSVIFVRTWGLSGQKDVFALTALKWENMLLKQSNFICTLLKYQVIDLVVIHALPSTAANRREGYPCVDWLPPKVWQGLLRSRLFDI